jgi:ATP-binding cassette, subfamily B (MDR/TAP), member 7
MFPTDLIIVLKDGGVAEQGTHEELLRRHGLYYEMWQAQADLPSNEPEKLETPVATI